MLFLCKKRTQTNHVRKFKQKKVAVIAAHVVFTETSPLLAVIQDPWQRKFMERVQDRPGATLCHMDATGQTNQYGYMLYSLLYRVRYLGVRSITVQC